MKNRKKAAIVCCSNGIEASHGEALSLLTEIFREMGKTVVFSSYIYKKDGEAAGTARERAQALMEFYRDDEIDMIFDISGGDMANEILLYLSYDEIAASHKIFWGYSDLTTVINAIYAKTGNVSVLYQVRNLLCEGNEVQRVGMRELIQESAEMLYEGKCAASSLFSFDYQRIQGGRLQGTVVGGNIRCFLKLAGTPFFPDVQDRVLFLESRSGRVPQISTYLSQLQQMGVFERVAGIVLGTFSEMEGAGCQPDVVSLVQGYVSPELPILKTYEIGHGEDSRALVIGGEISL